MFTKADAVQICKCTFVSFVNNFALYGQFVVFFLLFLNIYKINEIESKNSSLYMP